MVQFFNKKLSKSKNLLAIRDTILSHRFIFVTMFTVILFILWTITLALISLPQVNQYQQELELFQAFCNAALISVLFIGLLMIISNQAFVNEEKVGRILTNMHDGLLMINKDKKITFANVKICEMLSIEDSDVINQKLDVIFEKKLPVRINEFFKDKSLLSFSNFEIEIKTTISQSFTVLLSGFRSFNNKKNLNQDDILLIVKDINQLRKAEDQIKQLLHLEKLAAFGHLIEKVSHNINNPLSFLIPDSERLVEYVEDLMLMLKLYEELFKKVKAYSVDVSIYKNQLTILTNKLEANKAFTDLRLILEGTHEGLTRISQVIKELRNYSDDSETTDVFLKSFNKIVKQSMK